MSTRCVLFFPQLYSSFFVYQVANKLKGAEKILLALGYSSRQKHPPSSSNSSLSPNESQELVYKGEVDIDHVAETATDLVILLCNLELLQVDIKPSLHQSPILLADILKTWRSDSRGSNHEVIHDPKILSRRYPNVPGTVCLHHNLEGRNLQEVDVEKSYYYHIGGGDGTKMTDHASSHTIESEYRTMHVQPMQEGSPYSSKCHDSRAQQETSAGSGNLFQKSQPGPVDDRLHNPVNFMNDAGVTYVNESLQCRKRGESYTTQSSEADSFPVSLLQDIPRPNIDDLSDPVYSNEAEFSIEKDNFVGNSFNSDLLGFVVNPRSDQDAYDDSLIGRDYMIFSPDEATPAKPWERNNSSVEEVQTHNGRNPQIVAAEEVGTGTSSNRSVSSNLAKRSQSYDPDKLTDQQCKKPLLVTGGIYRSDSDLTASHDHMHATGHEEGSADTHQGNLNQLSSIVRDKPSKPRRTGGGQHSPSRTHMQANNKHNEHNVVEHGVWCESELHESEQEGFVVVDLCSESSGAEQKKYHESDKSYEKVGEPSGYTSMWTCDYCTNINSKERVECEICGIKK